ncbi:MAG: lipid II:glycine glycyltransferase FemX [Candidatus Helarchaeota archaeon]
MKILKNNEINRTKWKVFFEKNNLSTPFQSPEYYEFFRSVQGMSAQVFAVEHKNDLQALCVVTIQKEKGIRGCFSRRAIVYGGVLVMDNKNSTKSLDILLKTINKEIGKKVIYIEMINLNDYSKFKPIFIDNGWDYLQHLNFKLDCSEEKIAWNNLNSNRKRQLIKAFKSNVKIEEAKNINEVEEFYRILKNLYDNKIRKPLMPWNFFEQFFCKHIGKILLVKFKEKVIGGILCPVLKNKAIYEWYIAGLDHEYKKLSPSVVATYAAIQYGFKNNLKEFDFMGAGKPSDQYGVREFKSRFGGKLVEHGRFIKICKPFQYRIGKFGLKILTITKR